MSHDHDNHLLAELLDLDGEIFAGFWARLYDELRRVAGELPGGRIVDLGAGTGAATLALAQRFAGVEVLAVDTDPAMLAAVTGRAAELGLADRVRTVAADLYEGWPIDGPADVVWAARSLHHVGQPDRVLADILAHTRPGGLLALVELVEHERFLPDDLGFGRPGFEERCLAAVDAQQAGELHLHADWPTLVRAAGFTVLEARTQALRLDPPLPDGTARFARGWLARLRSGLAEQLAADDLATLDRLLDDASPESVLRRTDLRVRGERSVLLARRPAG